MAGNTSEPEVAGVSWTGRERGVSWVVAVRVRRL